MSDDNDFDCIKTKRIGSNLIYDQIKDLTKEEELNFWKVKTLELKERQKVAIKKTREVA